MYVEIVNALNVDERGNDLVLDVTSGRPVVNLMFLFDGMFVDRTDGALTQ